MFFRINQYFYNVLQGQLRFIKLNCYEFELKWIHNITACWNFLENISKSYKKSDYFKRLIWIDVISQCCNVLNTLEFQYEMICIYLNMHQHAVDLMLRKCDLQYK